jgi:hypothetical protein
MISRSESLAVEESSPKAPGILLEDEGLLFKPFMLFESDETPIPYELDESSRLIFESMGGGSDLTVEAEFLAQGSVRPEEGRPFCAKVLEAEELGGGRIPDNRSKAEGAAGRAVVGGYIRPPFWRLRANSASSFSCFILCS